LPGFEIPGAGSFDNPFPQVLNNYQFTGSISVPLTGYFLTIIHGYRAVRKGEAVGEALMSAATQNELTRAFSELFSFYYARAQVALATDSAIRLGRFVDDTARLVESGLLPTADLEAMRAREAEAVLQKARARSVALEAEQHLRSSLQLASPAPMSFAMPLTRTSLFPTVNAASLLELAYATRPDLRHLNVSRAIETDQARLHFGRMLPSVELKASVLYANPNPRVFPQQAVFNTTWAAGAVLSWSPNDLVDALDDYRDTRQTERVLDADIRGVRESIERDVLESVNAYNNARQALDAAHTAMKAADAAHRERVSLYNSGQSTALELLTSEAERQQAQLLLVRAYLDLHASWVGINRATGTLSDWQGKRDYYTPPGALNNVEGLPR
jgi:outer membrane protein TolC